MHETYSVKGFFVSDRYCHLCISASRSF